MQNIKQFIENFIQTEYEAKALSWQSDIDAFNKALEKMDNFLCDDLKGRFGMRKKEKPEPKEFYDQVNQIPPKKQSRYIFRIDKIGGEFNCHCVYVSQLGLMQKCYSTALLVKEIEGKLTVFSRFTWGHGRPEKPKKHFYNSGGENINYKELKPIVETLRILAPEDDEESMEMYLK
jgi:hypothetical protein